ncbi:MAG: DUF1275 domain-containing protein [Clostridia bacterium]|nr:DUF1275 domain-containing protein [Clostridia bacterium]
MLTHSKKLFAESFIPNAIMSLCGGFLDAYTYIVRDRIFANTQTGNFVLLGMNLAGRNYSLCIRYLVPIAAFSVGAFITSLAYAKGKNIPEHWWRRDILGLEILALAVVAFIPTTHNNIANASVSFACGLQAQSFRKVGGFTYASTMCTGNLRSFSAALGHLVLHDVPDAGVHCLALGGMLLFFTFGAAAGWALSELWGTYTVMIPCLLLAIVLLIMHRHKVVIQSGSN